MSAILRIYLEEFTPVRHTEQISEALEAVKGDVTADESYHSGEPQPRHPVLVDES